MRNTVKPCYFSSLRSTRSTASGGALSIQHLSVCTIGGVTYITLPAVGLVVLEEVGVEKEVEVEEEEVEREVVVVVEEREGEEEIEEREEVEREEREEEEEEK